MKKRIVLVLMLVLLIPFTSDAVSIEPRFRLASFALERFSYSRIYDAQIYSIYKDYQGEDYRESWRFWDNQSLYVSGEWYHFGDKLTRIFTADGYYCTSDQVIVPEWAYEARNIIDMPPAFLSRRCTDFTVNIITDGPSRFDVILKVNDYDSSFGASNAMYDEENLAEPPALVVAVPGEDFGHIIFDNYPSAVYHTWDWIYYVFDFPIVYYNTDLSGGLGALSLSYQLFEPVNISISLLDGWNRHESIDMGKAFPIPDNATFFVDFENETQIGEPIVWFMPQVELPIYGDWSEPSYNDYHPPVHDDTSEFYALLTVGILGTCCAIILIAKFAYHFFKGRNEA